MTTIAAAACRLKDRLPAILAPALIKSLCDKLALKCRQRILTPAVMVQLLVWRVLEANTAYAHLPHLAQRRFTPSAFCQALARLPLELLQELLAAVGHQEAAAAGGLFCGHRVLLADALCLSMPDTSALRERFGYPAGQAPGLGFPLAKLLLLLDVSTGLIRRVVTSPYRTHEASQAHKLHPELATGDILVADRAFCSFVHLALLLAQGCHGLFRAHQKLPWTFKNKDGLRGRIVGSLGRLDRQIIYYKPKLRPAWMSAEAFAALPQEIIVRELCYRVAHKGFRSRQVMLVTTLADGKIYAKEALADLYGRRWQIETQFRHLKETLGMGTLKGQSVKIIEREILAYVLAFNLLQLDIHQAALAQGVAPERISFLDAARWFLAGRPAGVKLRVNPLRPGRCEPRVRKRRPKTYPLMTQARADLKRNLMINPKKSSALT